MRQLGVELILAHSPQAKGRVERVNGTLQDRLVKALRLEGLNDLARANEYLARTVSAGEHNPALSSGSKHSRADAASKCAQSWLKAILELGAGAGSATGLPTVAMSTANGINWTGSTRP